MTNTDMTVANEIRNQIGHKALFMLGAQYLMGDVDALSFRIRGSKLANHVKVQLMGDDTYAVTFTKIRGLNCRQVAQVSDVYVDSLHDTIESNTGLRTSL
jgi:hypothetical protein